MYCGESAASGVPCASNLELRSATAVIACTRDERISKLRVSLNEVTPWEVPTVSVAIGSTVSSADWTPSCAKNEPARPATEGGHALLLSMRCHVGRDQTRLDRDARAAAT